MSDAPADAPHGQAIIAIGLDKPTRAEQVLLSLAHLQSEGRLQMHDAVIVAKDTEGKARIVETIDTTPAKGAMAGSWWGMLAGLLVGGPLFLPMAIGGAAAGALYGKLVDRGLDDAWVKQMADWAAPDSSVLLLLVDEGFDAAVIDELARFEGTGELVSTTLPDDVRREIEAALSGQPAEVQE